MRYQKKIYKNQATLPLANILEVFRGLEIDWKMTYLEAVGDTGGPMYMLELQDCVEKNRNGYSIDGEELYALAHAVDDILNITLLGEFSAARDNRSMAGKVRLHEYSVFLELFDSGVWTFASDNKCLYKKFVDVATNDPVI